MDWAAAVREAIEYMENGLLTVKSPEEVAEHVHISSMYLQKGFQIMTGFTISEYLRNRRLYLAAMELIQTDCKVIDAAMKYGYQTPESFAKAFTRFHGFSPTEIRKNRNAVKTFLPLRVTVVVQGGNRMEYTVERMAAFQVIGFSREFSFDSSYEEIPKFWDEAFETPETILSLKDRPLSKRERAFLDHGIGEFGVCIDDIGKDGKFRYMIAGRYQGGPVPGGMEVYTLPEMDWAKFPCRGEMPPAMQAVNTRIWNEWLPNNSEYELAGKYNVEWYSETENNTDSDYQSAVWIPVRRKM